MREPGFLCHDVVVKAFNCTKMPNADGLRGLVEDIARSLSTRIVSIVGYDFDPCGATCAAILATSHAVVHTYPERRFAYLNLSSCKDTMNLPEIMAAVGEAFGTTLIEHLSAVVVA